MRLASNSRLALLAIASCGSAVNASAGWATHGGSRAGTSSPQPGGTVNFVRPSTQHDADCSLRPPRPEVSLRGGCGSSAAGQNGESTDERGDGEVAAADRPAGAAVGDQGNGIDEDLYSRQLYVMGKTAMAKMGKADVLISGMSGLGAEVAKNVILAGVRSVTIHDDRPSTLEDLSSQFCLGKEAAEKGEGRARASVNHLRELNPYVDVRLLEGPLSEKAIEKGGYAAVLLVDETVGFQLRANEACRKAGTAFVSASSRGAFASLFCDFGDTFVVEDQDGEDAL
ncbi:unnamed protein product, partial [Scytosiphon promiscuus]